MKKRKTSPKKARRRETDILLERLESRVLFDAVPDIVLDTPEVAGQDDFLFAVQTEKAVAPKQEETRHELAFVDTSVGNYQALIDDLLANEDAGRTLEVVLLDADRDGIEQISAALAGRTGIDAIHLLSHGRDGAIQLGQTWLTLDNLGPHSGAIAGWGTALNADADLMIYGCNLAATASGQALTQALGALTGADVAASADDTGAASRGGNWSLEYSLGDIDTAGALHPSASNRWAGLLAPVVQEFYIPLPEAQIYDSLEHIYPSISGDEITTVISLTPTRDGTLIYYDHHEDGFEADLANPTQSSTEVWGDNDPSNGIAPGFAVDVINSADIVSLVNTISVTSPSGTPFDGGDRIGASKSIVVSRGGWSPSPGTVLAGTVEVADTSLFGTDYIVPIGEDTAGVFNQYEYVGLFVMAAEDGTTVDIDTDADGTVDISTTLNRGENYHVDGGILQGATVSASTAVQVDVISGDRDSFVDSRWYLLRPTSQWSDSYINPVGTTSSTDPTRLVMYNPNSTDITVNVETQSGTTAVVIAANSTNNFLMPNPSGTVSGARVSSTDGSSFYAVISVDSDSSHTTYDWGFSLVAEDLLSDMVVAGWGPGTEDLSANGSPIWVSAAQATTYYVDFDGDPTTGAFLDPFGNRYDQTISAAALESVRIFDSSDNDQTGTVVYTVDQTDFAAAWGIDPATAGAALPYLDMGTTVLPFPAPDVRTFAALATDANGNGKYDYGDEATWTVTITNNRPYDLTGAVLEDLVPTNTTYVLGSTTLDGSPVADDGAGTPMPLDEGGLWIGNLNPGQTVTVTFDVTFNSPAPVYTSVTNTADVQTNQGSRSASNTIGISTVVAVDDSDTTDEDTPLLGSAPGLLANDFSYDPPVTLTVMEVNGSSAAVGNQITLASGALLTVNSDGSYQYDPNGQFAWLGQGDSTTDTFEYTVSDGQGGCDLATMTVTITGATNEPGAVDDFDATDEDTVLIVPPSGVLANDLSPIAQPASGAVLVYDAAGDTDGNDFWEDATGLAGFDWDLPGKVTRSATPTTALPGITATYVFDDDGAKMDSLETLPGNPDQGSATFEIWFNPLDATDSDVIFETGGKDRGVSFTANQNTLEFRVEGDGVDQLLTADLTAKIAANEYIQIVGVIDLDSANPDLYLYVDGGLVGSAMDIGPLTDWANNKNSGLGEKHGEINGGNGDKYEGEIAIVRFYDSVLTENQIDMNYKAVTGDPIPLTVTAVNGSSGDVGNQITLTSGALLTLNSDGSYEYDPNGQYEWLAQGQATTDSFTYAVSDTLGQTDTATVTITINGVNDPPVAVNDSGSASEGGSINIDLAANDSDADDGLDLASIAIISGPANGSLTIHGDGTVTYTHDGSETTSDSFTYTIDDASGATSNVATVNLTINPVNDPPVAVNDSGSTNEGGSVNIDLAANDSDADDGLDLASIAIISGPANGSLTINGDGTVTYTHDGSETTSDSFTYTIDDVGGQTSNVATVNLTINPQNDPPVAVDDSGSTNEGGSVNIDLAANDSDADDGLDLTSIAIISGPANGSLTINGDGTVTYTHDGSETTSDSFTYTIDDASGATSNVATVNLTINPQNDPPVAVDDSGSANEGGSVNIDLTANDSDADDGLDLTSIATISGPANGSLTINGDGTVTYTHDGSETTSDSFTYTIDDLSGATSNVATVNLTINPQNDPPVAVDDAGSANEGGSVNIDLAANDSDADDGLDLTSIAIISGPANGSLTINGDGTVTYTHDGSETTSDSFTYTIDDASGATSNVATVNLTINPVNDPPVAVDDSGSANEGDSVNIDLAANDTDADDGLDLTSIAIISGPANGSLTINGDGTATYTHDGSETTSDSFTYTIDDVGGATSNVATVNLTINPQNDPPVAVNDSGSASEGGSVNIDLAANDSDADDGLDLTSIAIISGPANGSLTINGDGTVTYTHDGSETTSDSFTYTIDDVGGQTSNVATVNLTINPQNDPPVAVDDSGSTDEGGSVNIDLAANDSDADDGLDLTSIAIISGPANGSLTINGDGTVTYTHDGSETTSDSFTYTIDDASGATSNVATVNLTINPQNDPPVAVDDSGSANEGGSVNIDLAANDSDADDGLDLTSIATISGPANGSLTINGDGTVTYTHDGSETTSDSFTYTIDDLSGATSNVATVNLTINPQNDPPVAVDDAGSANEGGSVNIDLAANDSDADDGLDLTSIAIISGPANGSLTINGDGTVTYTHDGSETTSDSFTYTIDDASGATSNVATVNLTINPVNDPPVAVDDSGSANEGDSVNIDLAANDSDADDGLDLTSIAIISGPANGSLTIHGDGTVTYTHDGSETTSDSFTYTIDDVGGQTSNVATVNLTINPVNDPPVAVDDSGSTNEGGSVNIDLAANDSDADDGLDLTSIAIISGPANGSLTINGDGTVTYTHDGSETTSDSFTYTIDDASSATSNVATVNLTINPQNDPPVAVNDSGSASEGGSVNIDLAANDSDADDGLDLTSIAIISGPANGSLTINGDGTVTYTHDGSETTSDSFTYTIDDASGATSNVATVNLTINPQNDPPVAVDDSGSANEGGLVNIDLAANDSDADDGLDLTSIATISGPTNGSLTIHGDGTVTYTHDGSETTSDSFTYTIDDVGGQTSNVATVNLTINPQNDPPVAVDDSGSASEGGSVVIDLAANDSDADDGLDLTSIAIISGPANGSLTIHGDGTVTYTHDGSETTSDSFTYTIDDASGATSNVATVNLTINPQNDPPVAVDDSGSANEGGSVNIDLAANDSDADDGLDLTSIAIISGPANGSLTIHGDGTVTYTHDGSETTSDSFTYTIDDAGGATSNVATVNLSINSQNDPPVAVDDSGSASEGGSVNIDLAANDSDADDGLDLASIAIISGPANGSLTIHGDGTVTYTHDGSETTSDSFTYTIDDVGGQTSNVATVNLTINPQNDPPVAVDDSGSASEGGSVVIDLAANDSDDDDGLDLASIAIISGPANGSLTIHGDGTVTYTHDGSETTSDSFTYTIDDVGGQTSNVATVNLTINPQNDPPVAVDDSGSASEGGSVVIDLAANDSDADDGLDLTSIAIISGPANGSLTIHGDGTVTYTHDGSETTSDSFTYTIDDASGATSNVATVNLTINPQNDPPVAVDDSGSANEGGSVNIDLAANDSDADDGLDLTSIAIISGPANGSLTIHGDGTVTYTHDGSETTSDSFTYTIDDAGGGTSNVATVNLSINSQNDPPVAVDDSGSASEGGSVNIDLAANDSDADDGLDLTSIAIISGPANGSLTINGDGTVTYTHDGSETNSDSFTYTIDDASGATSNVATVNLTINPQNDPPVAVDDSGSASEGGSVVIDLAANDSDADDGLDLTSIAIISGPANGSLTINGDGTVTYTHDGSETNSDSFTYTIDDASGQTSNVATVNLTINPQNDPPVAVDDSGSASEGYSVVIDLAANDSDADDGLDLASIAIISGPANGSLTIHGDGTVTYTHDGSETTSDSFTYTIDDVGGQTSNVATVNLTINPQNDPPVAVDDSGSASEGGSVVIDLAANDSDADDGLDPASIAIISGPANGSLTIKGDGTVTYTHDGSETTSDSFTYTIDDASGATSNVATVNLTINPQNDPPVAVDDSGSANEGGSVNIDLAANDSDADDGLDLTGIAIISGPANGSLTINGDGTATYTHDGSETTSDSFTYTIDDASGATSNVATVNLMINPQNDPPVAVDDSGSANEGGSVNIDLAANDSDADDGLDLTSIAIISGPANGSLTINGDGTVTYTHDGSETTADSFTYTIDDASGATSNVATVNLTINPVNDPPVAVDDSGSANEGGSVNIDLAANDSDADDGLDLTSIAIISGPANGSLTIDGDGTVTYTHDGSDTTADSFTYTIDDLSSATSNVATVNLTINPQNDPPVAVDDSGSANEGGSVNIDLAANDSDADDGLDLTSIAIISGPANGSLTIHGDGTVTYTHDGSETTSDSFTYTIDDASGATSNVATVNLTINPQNDPPVAVDDAGSANEGGSVNIDLAANDSDADDGLDLASIAIISGPANGSLTIHGDGTITYTHDGSETTSDSFTYTIDDAGGATSNVATVNLTINPQNDPPVAVDDSGSANEGASVVIDLAANDSDTDDGLDLTSIAIISGPANGSLTIHGDGTVTYTHDGSETTSDSFTYTIDDASGATSNVATVNLTINPQNDPPVAVDDSGSANEGGSINIDLAANDSDADDGLDLISIAIISGPANGSLTIHGDGTVTYTHDGSETTSDSFTYTIDDAGGATSNVATINLTINPQNDPPVAVDDSGSANEGGSVNIDLAANDSDADDGLDLASIAITSGPANGSLTINGDGTVTYTHDGSETTADSFTYTIDDAGGATSNVATVNLTVSPQNDPPVAVDDHFEIATGGVATGNLLQNDSDPELDPLQLSGIPVVGPVHGTVTLNPDGTFEYQPNAGYVGVDTFVYEINDGAGGAAQATVQIDVTGSYAYDSFRNEAAPIEVRMEPVSQRTAQLISVDPIFTGFAEPGTTLVGKIYDSNGNLIGERTTSADGAGNWLMSFSNSVIHKQPHRMTVEQSGSLLAQGATGGFNLRRYYHTASQPSLFFSKQVSVASTIASMPSAVLHSMNEANEDPLMLGWAAHPYEMLASSPTASQM